MGTLSAYDLACSSGYEDLALDGPPVAMWKSSLDSCGISSNARRSGWRAPDERLRLRCEPVGQAPHELAGSGGHGAGRVDVRWPALVPVRSTRPRR
jgi:hypothetical protein